MPDHGGAIKQSQSLQFALSCHKVVVLPRFTAEGWRAVLLQVAGGCEGPEYRVSRVLHPGCSKSVGIISPWIVC